MSRTATFIIGMVLGTIIGGVLIMYFLSPRVSTGPKYNAIQAPDGAETTAGTAAIQLRPEFFTPVIQSLFNGENGPAFPLSLSGQAADQPVAEITCGKIILQRENSGVATGVRMENGQILIPIAFTGNVNAFGSCFNFSGWSESKLALQFDEQQQIVFGQIEVQTVNLEGVSPVVSTFLTPLVQSTINTRFNPVQILRGDQIAIKAPVKSTGSILQGKVKNIRADVKDNALNLYLTYDFSSEKQTQ